MDSDKQWEIEQDARTLVNAEMIKMDKSRHKKAMDFLKKENAARKKAAGSGK